MRTVKYVLLICAILWSATGYSDRYVTTNGPSTSPYTNWAQAATNIQTAVNIASAGETIWVSNGFYQVASRILVDRGVTVKSVNGYQATVILGNQGPVITNQCLFLSHSNAVFDGFTFTNGMSTSGNGGGNVIISGGTLQNCLVTGGWSTGTGGGLEIFLFSPGGVAIVQNCVIIRNRASYGAGGINVRTHGIVQNCLVSENTGGGGSIIENVGGIAVVNIKNNYNGYGYISGCTVVSNVGYHSGGIGFSGTNNGTSVFNCVVYKNRATGPGASTGTNDLYDSALPTNIYAVSYSCASATNVFSGAGLITNAPLFADTNTANYRLTRSSPGLNAGTNQAWMNGTSDLDGRSRIDRFSGKVDMGCYEYLPGGVIFGIR